jgi:hypothetical protein
MVKTFKLFECPRVVFLLPVLLTILTSATVAVSQSRTSSNLPGPGVREGNRAMDDYDRDINRMKNDARVAKEKRQNLFPQINEDFQRIQVIHNEMVRMLQPDKGLNYDRLVELTDDMKKRSSRLRENLALPQPEKSDSQPTHSESIDEPHVRKTIVALHDLVVDFVANPLFKNLGVVDANVIDSARQNLYNIINVSDEIKKEAKLLGKSAKK